MKNYFLITITCFFSLIGTAAEIDVLPIELRQLILSNARIKDILNFCASTKQNQMLCHEDQLAFWKTLVARDFGVTENGDESKSWKQLYIELHQWIKIPAGTYFDENRYNHEGSKLPNELIEHKSFEIQNAAITQEKYTHVMGENPSKFKEQRYCPLSYKIITVDEKEIPVCADHPVETVSFPKAKEFAQRLSNQDPHYNYSVPKSIQLLVAFKGGVETKYISGDDPTNLDEYVWSRENSNDQTHPVRSKRSNRFGIYSSSVQEWSKSTFYYMENKLKATAGCSFDDMQEWCTVLHTGSSFQRYYGAPEIGFRLTRKPKNWFEKKAFSGCKQTFPVGTSLKDIPGIRGFVDLAKRRAVLLDATSQLIGIKTDRDANITFSCEHSQYPAEGGIKALSAHKNRVVVYTNAGSVYSINPKSGDGLTSNRVEFGIYPNLHNIAVAEDHLFLFSETGPHSVINLLTKQQTTLAPEAFSNVKQIVSAFDRLVWLDHNGNIFYSEFVNNALFFTRIGSGWGPTTQLGENNKTREFLITSDGTLFTKYAIKEYWDKHRVGRFVHGEKYWGSTVIFQLEDGTIHHFGVN